MFMKNFSQRAGDGGSEKFLFAKSTSCVFQACPY